MRANSEICRRSIARHNFWFLRLPDLRSRNELKVFEWNPQIPAYYSNDHDSVARTLDEKQKGENEVLIFQSPRPVPQNGHFSSEPAKDLAQRKDYDDSLYVFKTVVGGMRPELRVYGEKRRRQIAEKYPLLERVTFT